MSIYFAYGSNLKIERMCGRVPSARALGPGRLPDRCLTLDKRGRDGSGKANLTDAAGSSVWGVLYEIDPAHWGVLDACEDDYARVSVTVVTRTSEHVSAETYVAERFTADPVPFDWYKALMVDGAREHGLPVDYVAGLAALPERPDPRRTRKR